MPEQSLILRWNGTSWAADSTPTAGATSPLYGTATVPGATSESAVGGNGANHALVLVHG